MVSPLLIFLQPMIAPISPALMVSRICISSALTLINELILSTVPKLEFRIFYRFFKTPEYTLKKVMSPFSLSFTTLNAKAQNLPLELASNGNSSSFSLSKTTAAFTSFGDGKYLMIPSIKGYTPLFFSALPQKRPTAFYSDKENLIALSISCLSTCQGSIPERY